MSDGCNHEGCRFVGKCNIETEKNRAAATQSPAQPTDAREREALAELLFNNVCIEWAPRNTQQWSGLWKKNREPYRELADAIFAAGFTRTPDRLAEIEALHESILAQQVRMQGYLRERDAALATIESARGFAQKSLDDDEWALSAEDTLDILAAHPTAALAEHDARVWEEGVATALNHAIRNDDGITLRLEHLDGRKWDNPYRAQGDGTSHDSQSGATS